MYDRGLSVLEQYGLESTAVYRGRGALICQTDQGFVLIKEFCGTPKKLEYQACLLSCICEKSKVLADEILVNREGNYISADKDNVSYVVKRWYEGRECDTRSEEDIYKGIAAMADLHRVMQLPIQTHYVRQPLTTEFARHNAELRKIRKFVSAKRKKNEFELEFLDTIRRFLGHGEEALGHLEASGYTQLYENTLEHGLVCHGEFNQHNVLMVREKSAGKAIAVTNFDKWGFDVQMVDLYQFMRKILEKHDWDIPLGKSMIQAYEEIRPLSKTEKENLKIRFAYPEKYWKLANYYYTHNKAWISKKNLEKLERLANQEEKWRNFVESL